MKLFSPLQIGTVTARNRIIFGPHETNLGSRRSISPRHVAYYRRRAAGGTGIIVIEEASVHSSDWPYERCPLARECSEGWAVVAKALHEYGTLAIAAIGHSGGQGSSSYSQAPLWAPSSIPDVVSREVPKPMEPDDIAEVLSGFGEATQIAINAGLDGVEVNAGQYSLIRQFLSELTNHRNDEYGIDRLKFAREVLSTVRAAAGSAIVGLRLSCDEMVPWGGITPETAVEIVGVLADHVDYVAVVRGSIYSTWATRPDGHVEPGFNLTLGQRMRSVLPRRVAVIAQGSIVDVAMAENALRDGVCDGVEMTRAQIADPDLAAKGAAGQVSRIRPCILCNQACQVRDVRNPIVSCVGEPSSGHELEDRPVEGKAPVSADVMVVGGGPSGLECARVAAMRGHRVRLVEKSGVLGGSVRIAAAGAGRSRLAALVDWLESECRLLGVRIETGREITAGDLASSSTVVVLCTGNRPGYRDYVVDDGATVFTARETLEMIAKGDTGLTVEDGPVAIWDPIGGPIAVSIAELLAARRKVMLVTPDFTVGKELSRCGDLVPANTRLHKAGVLLLKRFLLRRVGKGIVDVEERFSGATQQIEAVALIDCGPLLPNDALWRSTGKTNARAGDAVAPRSIYEAVLEGRRVAMLIGESL